MLQLKVQGQRIQLILNFLKEQAFMRASFAQIQEHLNSALPLLGLKTISRRTLESDLQVLRDASNDKLLHVRVSKKHYYQLLPSANAQISEAVQASMLSQIAEQLGAKLPTAAHSLQHKLIFNLTALNDDGASFQLAATCLQAIEQQYIIQFLYQACLYRFFE